MIGALISSCTCIWSASGTVRGNGIDEVALGKYTDQTQPSADPRRQPRQLICRQQVHGSAHAVGRVHFDHIAAFDPQDVGYQHGDTSGPGATRMRPCGPFGWRSRLRLEALSPHKNHLARRPRGVCAAAIHFVIPPSAIADRLDGEHLVRRAWSIPEAGTNVCRPDAFALTLPLEPAEQARRGLCRGFL